MCNKGRGRTCMRRTTLRMSNRTDGAIAHWRRKVERDNKKHKTDALDRVDAEMGPNSRRLGRDRGGEEMIMNAR